MAKRKLMYGTFAQDILSSPNWFCTMTGAVRVRTHISAHHRGVMLLESGAWKS